jgi:hypothetical protein
MRFDIENGKASKAGTGFLPNPKLKPLERWRFLATFSGMNFDQKSSVRSAMFIANGASRVPSISVRSGMELKRSNAQLGIRPVLPWAPFGHAAPDGDWLIFVARVYYRHGAPNGACAPIRTVHSIENSEEPPIWDASDCI